MATENDLQVFAVATKAPGENLALDVDFTAVLGAGEEISNGSISTLTFFTLVGTVDPVNVNGGTNNGLRIRLSGGTLGDVEDITVTATTNASPTNNIFVRVLRVVAGFKATIDRVRYLVGDQDTSDELARDDEYVWALCENGDNIYQAAAVIARGIAGKFARRVNTAADGVSTEMSQMFDHYSKLAGDLAAIAESRTGSSSGGVAIGAPIVTGIDTAEVRAQRASTTRVQNRAYPGLDDNPGIKSTAEDQQVI